MKKKPTRRKTKNLKKSLRSWSLSEEDMDRWVQIHNDRLKQIIVARKDVANKVLSFVKEYRKKGFEVELSIKQWHQLSQELGGIFIYRVLKRRLMPRKTINDPYVILTFDEMVKKLGKKETSEMAKDCRELGAGLQRKVALAEIKRCGYTSVSAAARKMLKIDGVDIGRFKKID